MSVANLVEKIDWGDGGRAHCLGHPVWPGPPAEGTASSAHNVRRQMRAMVHVEIAIGAVGGGSERHGVPLVASSPPFTSMRRGEPPGGRWSETARRETRDSCRAGRGVPRAAFADSLAAGRMPSVVGKAFSDGKYTGEVNADGKRDGHGTTVYTWGVRATPLPNGDGHAVADGLAAVSQGSYVGEYKNNKKEGHGVMKSPGSTYEGQWKNDKMEGKGTNTWKNGRRWVPSQ